MVFYEEKGRYIIDFTDIPTRRAVMPEIPAEDRKVNFKEIETGLPEDVAVAEAKRCLSCRRCLGCALCWAECKPEAIDFGLPDRHMELDHIDKIILTSGLHQNVAPIVGNISDKYMNVVTDLQTERMLSVTGPSNGLVIRPQDGEIPKRIAFVQTFEPKDNAIRDASLIFGINEAVIIRKRIAGVNVSVISPSMDPFWKDTESVLKELSGISFIAGTIVEATEVAEDKKIQLKYVTKELEKIETFDLVILLTQPQLSESIKQSAERLAVKVDATHFLGRCGKTIKTDHKGVVLAQGL